MTSTVTREQVYKLINLERERQQELGKSESHGDIIWFVIATDYLGRIASHIWKGDEILTPVIKVAAVLVAWIENRYRDVSSLS